MADRGTLRVAFTPLQTGRARVWFKSILPGSAARPRITGFGHSLQPFHTGDMQQAFAMYAGHFSAAGQTIEATAAYVFDQTEASHMWQTEMHKLSWLRHFAASNLHLHAHYAIRILGRWAKARRPKLSVRSQCEILFALATDGAALARIVEQDLQKDFFAISAKQTFKVLNLKTRSAEEAVDKAASILAAITAFKGLESLQKQAVELLEANIEKLVLADGAHISQHPDALLDLLSVVLPLKQAMKTARHVFPANTSQALDRMMVMLVTLRHGDGSLAFAEPPQTQKYTVDQCLRLDDSAALPRMLSPQSRIARLVRGKLCLIAKTGTAAQFELSTGEHRLFTSIASGEQHHAGPAQVTEVPEGVFLLQDEGQPRQRTYFMSDAGHDLRIEDRYDRHLEIVFEMAPDVKIAALRESKDLLLVLPDRTTWKLQVRGADVLIEQNGKILKFFSTGSGRLNWALKLQAKPGKTQPRKKDREPDLLI